MLSQLRAAAKVVGVKQSKKVIRDGGAAAVFVASDAEARVTRPILELCQELRVEVTEVPTMQELGRAAGIDVGAAVVVQLRETAGDAN
ncbi:MAG: L7Ae/L30e/S12e/Gadd45 family ribosomal protein [Intestinibacillus sp.]